ncbi:MAG: sorbosone dehydrogenase family protein [Calditrichaeota bacterium]|nr:MAG: sorbosone dehydrogenase family protein [Calditrichota bacterium]
MKLFSKLYHQFVLILLIFVLFLACSQNGTEPAEPQNNPTSIDFITLPPQFKMHVFADVPNARSLTISPSGTIFVGTRSSDKIYALYDKNNDHLADTVITIASGLNTPNGVAFRNGSLYIAEINRVLRLDNIEEKLLNPPNPVVVRDDFPTDGHHGWKFIRFGPDEKLYVPVGAPCNICEPDPNRYANIMRMNPDGSGLEVFAFGVRNSVGFDWHPQTQELWFTDNGRDYLGDNSPPDELNHAPQQAMHFGYPYWHGGDIKDPQFGDKRAKEDFTAPAQKLGPHVAALGMRFYTGTMFPVSYKNNIFIAEHGSWNRSTPIGYRLMLVRLKNGQPVSYEEFATGFLQGETRHGRPVDIEIMHDGSLLVSDDFAGKIYRIYYENP